MNAVYDRLAPYYFQTAYVVRDQAAAERCFERIMGVPEWIRIDITLREGCTYRGQPADTDLRISLGFAGEVNIELIESVRGDNIYEEMLATGRTGLHHTGFVVDDFAGTVAALRAEGLPVVAEGVAGTTHYAYFDATGEGMSVIEIIHFDDATRAVLADLKTRSRDACRAR